MLEEHRRQTKDWGFHLWALLNLSLWYERWIDLKKVPQINADKSKFVICVICLKIQRAVGWTFATRVLMIFNSVAAGIIVAHWLGAEGRRAVGGHQRCRSHDRAARQLRSTFIKHLLHRAGPGALPRCRHQLTDLRARLGSFWPWASALLLRCDPTGLVSFPRVDPYRRHLDPVSTDHFDWSEHPARSRKIREFNLLDLAGQSFVLINAVLVLLAEADLETLVTLNTAASILVSIVIALLLVISGKHLVQSKWRADIALLRRMIVYGLKFHISILAGAIIIRADLLVVNHFRGAAEAGVYSVASQFALLLMLLPGVIATLLFPRVTAEQDARGETTCLVSRYTTFIMFLCCLAAVPLSLLLPLIYGAAFSDATKLLLILLPGVYLMGLESVLVQHFNALGVPRAIPLYWVATLALNLVLVFALVPRFGAQGAAIASTISYAAIFAWSRFTFTPAPDDLLPRYLCSGACADESCSAGAQRRLISLARQTGPTLSRLFDRTDLARRIRNRQSHQTSQVVARLRPDVLAIATERLPWQRGQNLFMVFGALAGAREVLMIDAHGGWFVSLAQVVCWERRYDSVAKR